MYADDKADTPAKTVSSVTARSRLALPLGFAWGFAFAMGFLYRADLSVSLVLDVAHQVVEALRGCVAGGADDSHAEARAFDVIRDSVTDQGRGDSGGEDAADDPTHGDRLLREKQASRHGEAAEDGSDDAVLEFRGEGLGVDGRGRAQLRRTVESRQMLAMA
jgi:hypothetical protein